jgi:hypothetical protein
MRCALGGEDIVLLIVGEVKRRWGFLCGGRVFDLQSSNFTRSMAGT